MEDVDHGTVLNARLAAVRAAHPQHRALTAMLSDMLGGDPYQEGRWALGILEHLESQPPEDRVAFPSPGDDRDGPSGRDEAVARLAHYALVSLWNESDFQPDESGCCHVCCAPCAALLWLDQAGQLDDMLAAWPEGVRDSGMFSDGQLDRRWMYRQWSGSVLQRQCGHDVRAADGIEGL